MATCLAREGKFARAFREIPGAAVGTGAEENILWLLPRRGEDCGSGLPFFSPTVNPVEMMVSGGSLKTDF